ncbi:MAG: hypothetical protein K6G15_01010, partial [Desulfovibrio sp.]|nr:hypothetical protein [Desulfovibrio sp.]
SQKPTHSAVFLAPQLAYPSEVRMGSALFRKTAKIKALRGCCRVESRVSNSIHIKLHFYMKEVNKKIRYTNKLKDYCSKKFSKNY